MAVMMLPTNGDDVEQHGNEKLVESVSCFLRHGRRLLERVETDQHHDECDKIDDAVYPGRYAENAQNGCHDGEDGSRTYLTKGYALFFAHCAAKIAQTYHVEHIPHGYGYFSYPCEYPEDDTRSHHGKYDGQAAEKADHDGAYREDEDCIEDAVGRMRPVLYILFHKIVPVLSCRIIAGVRSGSGAYCVRTGCTVLRTTVPHAYIVTNVANNSEKAWMQGIKSPCPLQPLRR